MLHPSCFIYKTVMIGEVFKMSIKCSLTAGGLLFSRSLVKGGMIYNVSQ